MFRNPTTDLLLALVIVLLILGPKRLPSLGRSLGQGMREFKDSITGHSKGDEDEERAELPAGSSNSTDQASPTGHPAPSEAAPGSTPEAAPQGTASDRDSVGSSEPHG